VLDLRIRKQPPSVLTGHATHLPVAMEDGWPKGYCYIEYNKLSDAVAACEYLGTNQQLMFYGKPLHVAYASPRSSEVVSFKRALFDPMVDH
jgi:RNA recognition motif-containing protein